MRIERNREWATVSCLRQLCFGRFNTLRRCGTDDDDFAHKPMRGIILIRRRRSRRTVSQQAAATPLHRNAESHRF
ncbi:hypothetical protein E2C01_017093 [Portunus trituberculatus]|uniref:Uncharacterized protein n=1 Tax=Portunus trituberculatus TaxID=210409 RepID=A0A5B7DSP2_PORTR|nr:hypothetical protein [Portunus trituberculatus]